MAFGKERLVSIKTPSISNTIRSIFFRCFLNVDDNNCIFSSNPNNVLSYDRYIQLSILLQHPHNFWKEASGTSRDGCKETQSNIIFLHILSSLTQRLHSYFHPVFQQKFANDFLNPDNLIHPEQLFYSPTIWQTAIH